MKSDYDSQEWRLVPRGHWNWKWNAARSHYHTYEQELLAGVLVLASQHRILGTNPITWLCDQDSVKYFMERPPPDGKRLRRWWVYLSQLRLTTFHIRGIKNELCDYLSRNCFDSLVGADTEMMAQEAFAKMDQHLDLFTRKEKLMSWSMKDLTADYFGHLGPVDDWELKDPGWSTMVPHVNSPIQGRPHLCPQRLRRNYVGMGTQNGWSPWGGENSLVLPEVFLC